MGPSMVRAWWKCKWRLQFCKIRCRVQWHMLHKYRAWYNRSRHVSCGFPGTHGKGRLLCDVFSALAQAICLSLPEIALKFGWEWMFSRLCAVILR
jgi:hypothetical protein